MFSYQTIIDLVSTNLNHLGIEYSLTDFRLIHDFGITSMENINLFQGDKTYTYSNNEQDLLG